MTVELEKNETNLTKTIQDLASAAGKTVGEYMSDALKNHQHTLSIRRKNNPPVEPDTEKGGTGLR